LLICKSTVVGCVEGIDDGSVGVGEGLIVGDCSVGVVEVDNISDCSAIVHRDIVGNSTIVGVGNIVRIV